MSYEEQTKEELQEELRERDLKVSGTKDELVERLEDDDESGDEGFEDQTKEELQEELRERELKVSGTKDELVERLEEDEASADDEDEEEPDEEEPGEEPEERETRDERSEDRRDDRSQRRRMTARDALRSAAQELQELGGRQVDGVAGFERVDGGWRVLLEVVEVSRVPSSTDILGAYEVMVDDEGELVGYERIRRYVRSQAGGDEE